jgi:predicted DCC family thiol-disulfide oxidoreductase YuxK
MAHPSKHIILFDGFCVLCNSSVNWLLRHDKKDLFLFAPLQSPAGKKLAAEHKLPEKIDTVIMISPSGKVYMHSDVMLEAFRIMGGGYKILSGLSLIPKVLRDGFYRIVAKYRYRWFGKKEACVIPDPKWKERFLQ